ncbi:unnamed protein product, partial [Callosobruchus maculatus]
MGDGGLGQGLGLDAIRALHQTVIALRTALEESKSEILELKSKAWPIETVHDALTALTIENAALKRKIVQAGFKDTHNKAVPAVGRGHEEAGIGAREQSVDNDVTDEYVDGKIIHQTHKDRGSGTTNSSEQHKLYPSSEPVRLKKVHIVSPKVSPKKTRRNFETKISVKAETSRAVQASRSLESLTVIKSPLEGSKHFSFSKTFSFSDLSTNIQREFNFDVKMGDRNQNAQAQQNAIESSIDEEEEEVLSPQNDLDQADEVDDIELIFTTDDTKESDFKEQLVSIDAGENLQEASNILQLPLSEIDQNFDVSDRELEDDVFNDENADTNSLHPNDIKRENSHLCDSKSDMSINQEKSMKSYYSLQDSSFENKSLEKDESFDRFDEKVRIVETDISKCGIHDIEYIAGRRNTCPNPIQYRPLLHREALSKGLTVGRKSRPILTHSNAIRKESGAQTDISALPGSSWRSESSLANKSRLGENFPTLPSKFPLPGSRLRLSEKTVEARRVLLSDIGFTSMVPELSRSADHLFPPALKPPGPAPAYGQYLRTTDLYSPGYGAITSPGKQSLWTASVSANTSGERSHYGSTTYPLNSPPVPPSRRCSAPVSPSRRPHHRPRPSSSVGGSRVRFANGSLPELRAHHTANVSGEWDSGESTDSLVEEAETFLRRSIDCIVTGRSMAGHASQVSDRSGGSGGSVVPRRLSAPDSQPDTAPPPGWRPFLPRTATDLRPDHWVKVIAAGGGIRGGRVRYVGPVIGQEADHVGVQLPGPDGANDGTLAGRRYFQW